MEVECYVSLPVFWKSKDMLRRSFHVVSSLARMSKSSVPVVCRNREAIYIVLLRLIVNTELEFIMSIVL